MPTHDEAASRDRERRERLDRRREPLAREAAADEESRERAGGQAGLGPRARAVPRAVRRVESHEIDPVVHHRQTTGRHAVERLDLAPADLGDGDDLRRSREDAALERQDDPVIEAPRPATGLARQVGAMAPLAGAIHVLTERALVALHDVPVPARNREPARSWPAPGRAPPTAEAAAAEVWSVTPRIGAWPRGLEQVNLVAVLDERRHQAGGRLLDSAVEHERPRDDEEPFMGAGAVRPALTEGGLTQMPRSGTSTARGVT